MGKRRGTSRKRSLRSCARSNVSLIAPRKLELWDVGGMVAVLLASVGDIQARSDNVRFGSKADI
jgi:hypothetical protein